MKTRTSVVYVKAALILPGILLGQQLSAQENGSGGGLGGVSTCAAAPQIAASAIAFSLSPQSGLNGEQATAQIRNVAHQATVSAPYLAAQIAAAAVQAVSRPATATVVSGQGLPKSTSAEEAKTTTAQKSITTTEGYKEAIAAITKGVISGSVHGGDDISTMMKVCSAIAVELVKGAAEQAEATASVKQAGTSRESSRPPTNDIDNGVAASKAFFATIGSEAARLGFNPQDVTQIINAAGTAAVEVANKIAGQVPGGVSGQVAQQVTAAVAKTISASTEAKSTQQTQNNNQDAPNPTAAGLPGESQDPFNGAPRIPQPSPTPNLTSSPTTTPTPAPTPIPASSGGTR